MQKKFNGFSVPNFIQTPPEFFDLLINDREINFAEIRLLGFMIRATYGWQRKGYSLEITFSDLEKYLGFGRSTANRAISSLLDRGYIERVKVEGTDKYKYRLVLSEEEEQQLNVTWDSTFKWKKVFDEPVKKRTKQEDTQSHGETTQFHDETTQSHSETTESHNETTQFHDETAQSHIETDSGSTMKPGRSHDETKSSITMKLGKEPPTQAWQGIDDSLKILKKVEDIDQINKIIEDEEDDDSIASRCKQIFENEVVKKLKIPNQVIEMIYEQLEWESYTPVAFERVCIKFRNRMKLGKININPIEWLKSAATNEEIVHYNQLTNVEFDK